MTPAPPPGCGCYPGHLCRLCQRAGLAPRPLPCVHEGAVLEFCATCGPAAEGRHVRDCDRHERCTRTPVSDAVASCATCPDFAPQSPPAGPVRERWRLADPRGALPGLPPGKHRFNASLAVYRGRRLLAYRDGWEGSNVHVAVLDAEYHPTRDVTLHHLRNDASLFGREDPRLFTFRDRLHVSYTGFSRGVTSVLYARLTDELEVEQVYTPAYAKRREWEKNWAFFESGDELFCVYESSPDHRVLRIDGHRAEDAFETPNPWSWSGGYHRGGASPVRVGDRFYHWFHGAWDLGAAWPTRRYNAGLLAFEAAPPFRVVAQTPHPLLVADPATRPPDQYCDVLFPGGAVRDGDSWVVSMGVHDRWVEFARFDAAAAEAAMRRPP